MKMLNVLVVMSAGIGQAATYTASPQGSDSNAGTFDSPWKTLTHAFSRLSAGDTLQLRGGTYFERVTLSKSGTPTARITVRAYPGEHAVLDSGPSQFRAVGNDDWELVNASLGEYRSKQSVPAGRPYGYIVGVEGYENERVGLVPYASASHFRSTTDQHNSSGIYVGPGLFYDASDQRLHVRLSKTTDLRACERRYKPVLGAENANPKDYSIIISTAPTTLTVSGSYIDLIGITVHQAVRALNLVDGATHIRIDDVTVWTGDSAIEGAGTGVHDIQIVRSRVYGDDMCWVFWSDEKDAPMPADYARGTSIDLRDGTHDWEISYTHVRGGHDGIGVNDNERDLRVHHNRIENFKDDAFEIEATVDVGRIDIYENYIANSLIVVAPGQDSAKFTGPLNFYRNVAVLLRNHPVNRKEGLNSWNGGGRFGFHEMFKHSASDSFATANTHIYHNTLVLLNSTGAGINPTPRFAQNTDVVNNILITVNDRVVGAYKTGSGQVIDGNLYWKLNGNDGKKLVASYETVPAFSSASGFERHGLGAASNSGTDPQFVRPVVEIADRSATRWEPTAASEVSRPSSFLLSSTSPARGRGVSLRTGLPESRTSNDLGAFPFGTTAESLDVFPFVLQAPTPGRPAAPTNLRRRP